MSRNKTTDARAALNRIAKMNKSRVPVDEMVDEMLLDEANVNEKNKGLLNTDLFSDAESVLYPNSKSKIALLVHYSLLLLRAT